MAGPRAGHPEDVAEKGWMAGSNPAMRQGKPIAYCLLPIAYCLLPIAYCLVDRERKVFVVDRLVGAVGDDRVDRLVEALPERRVALGDGDADAFPEPFRILERRPDEFAALPLRIFRQPAPKRRAVAEHRIDRAAGEARIGLFLLLEKLDRGLLVEVFQETGIDRRGLGGEPLALERLGRDVAARPFALAHREARRRLVI